MEDKTPLRFRSLQAEVAAFMGRILCLFSPSDTVSRGCKNTSKNVFAAFQRGPLASAPAARLVGRLGDTGTALRGARCWNTEVFPRPPVGRRGRERRTRSPRRPGAERTKRATRPPRAEREPEAKTERRRAKMRIAAAAQIGRYGFLRGNGKMKRRPPEECFEAEMRRMWYNRINRVHLI